MSVPSLSNSRPLKSRAASTGVRLKSQAAAPRPLTQGVCIVDEVEWRKLYNQACDTAIDITNVDPDLSAASTQRTVLFILQLLESLQAQIDDMTLDDC